MVLIRNKNKQKMFLQDMVTMGCKLATEDDNTRKGLKLVLFSIKLFY